MKEHLHALRPDLTDVQLERFQKYYELLVDWNTRMNLTAITEAREVAEKHFADSLAAAAYISDGAHCVDVGTGAGFPGVPLMILRDDITVTLLDGLNKRLIFLETVLRELGLTDRATLLHARAEDAGRDPKHRGKYDIALTRAVANLSVLMELTVPLLKVGGKSICYKGDAEQEVAGAKGACHLLHASVDTADVPAEYGKRTLVFVTKNEPTPKTYPRKAGTPAKKPL
ncbi:MAG: 16S rRNA (guanine(527)-N(7))-methyltransferase RsmG [Clostridia bacterium]|nr:16S rRNA (guanine(527)-N(7))-methyltransferase RsmG [Clostridia bacterium]